MSNVYVHGRWWDAPATDDAREFDLTGTTCVACQETVTSDDDAMMMGSVFHTECWLRSALGDVAHLEGRCLCSGGSDHDEEGTYREQSRRTLDWLTSHSRGRWRS